MRAMTIPLPDDIKREIEDTKSVNWVKVASRAIIAKAAHLRLFKGIVSGSRLTQKDALEIGRKINADMHRGLQKKKGG